ncbi:carbohydrate ABC transporter permease [Treponema sp. OMZ 840]|uniref:carbohydrate ABC transporter permease n=1 Tax=Treponema sp. OMZ 840 TaxID=244313 RepID=UPI003D913912
MLENKKKRIISQILVYFILVIVIAFIGFPLVYAFGGSFKTINEFLVGGTKIFPDAFQWQNYTKAWKQANFARYTLNSIFFSLFSVIGTVITTSMTGYIMSRFNFPGKKILTLIFAVMLFLIGAVTLYPIFLLCNKMGLLNSIWGMVIAEVATLQPFYSILIMGYCDGIPKQIDESARIDGAGTFRIYIGIILPIIKPILATSAILSFRDSWNNYMMPLAFTIAQPKLRTLTVGVVLLKDQGDGIAAWNTMLAGTIMSILPILIVYMFCNRYFIEGMTQGSIKE